jgi:hypothetical protein
MSERGDVTQQQALLRESANRARRLARTMLAAEDREKLYQYADELEQQALSLEQQGGLAGMPPPVQQVQVQVQQQQQHESVPTADDDPKSKSD